jgi:YggT family protein
VIVVIVRLIQISMQVITLLVILHVVLSYFLSPFHPVRAFVDRLIFPLLDPIRRVVPPLGMFDLSPLVLLLLVQLLGSVLINTLLTL